MTLDYRDLRLFLKSFLRESGLDEEKINIAAGFFDKLVISSYKTGIKAGLKLCRLKTAKENENQS